MTTSDPLPLKLSDCAFVGAERLKVGEYPGNSAFAENTSTFSKAGAAFTQERSKVRSLVRPPCLPVLNRQQFSQPPETTNRPRTGVQAAHVGMAIVMRSKS
jgi:hypothetical protein